MAYGGGPGVVNLGINASGFIGQLNAVVSQTNTVNNTINHLNVTLNQVQPAANNANNALNRMLGTLAAVASFQGIQNLYNQFQAATKEAAAFSRQIGLIQTITADSGVTYQGWADGIRKVSDELGLPIADAAAASYDLLSNQVTRAADTFDVLRTAANLANLTNSTLTQSVNALSNVINAYGYSQRDAETIAAKFFVTVDLGRVKLSEFEATAGRTLETGKSLGASYEEINAGLIAITQTGVKTNTAMTLLNNVFSKLLKPTKEMQELFDELGVGTGENFVKLYGLAGALEQIEKKTKGSTAASQKYFNELRSSQGYQILTDQMAAFKNGLAEQDQALERAARAKKDYEATPGFKAQKEINAFQNELLLSFQTGVLNSVNKLTDMFGGLTAAMHAAFTAATITTAAFVGQKAIMALGAIEAAKLGAALASLAAPVTLTVLIAGIGAIAYAAYEANEAVKGLHDAIGSDLYQQAEARIEAQQKQIAAEADAARKAAQEGQKKVLEATASARRQQVKIDVELARNGEGLKESLKNAIELALSAAKRSLKAVEQELDSALQRAKAAANTLRDSRGNRGDAIYNFLRARDQAETGGANERQIMNRRLDQLQDEMNRARSAGDLESYNKAKDRAESIINEAATATNPNGSLKYEGSLSAIESFYEKIREDVTAIQAIEEARAAVLERQREVLAGQVKEAEDAGKALLELSARNKDGSRRFANPAELEAEIAAKQRAYDAKIGALQANPLAAGQGVLRGGDLFRAQSEINRRVQEVREAAAADADNIRGQQRSLGVHDQINAMETASSKIVAAAVARINETADRVQAAYNRSQYAEAERRKSTVGIRESALAGTGAFHDIGLFTPKQEKAIEDELLGLANAMDALANKGDFKGAQEKLKEIEAFYRRFGLLDKEVLKTGRKDASGNVIDKTPAQQLAVARGSLAAEQRARAEQAAQQKSYDQARTFANGAFDGMKDSLDHFKAMADEAGKIDTKAFDAYIAKIEAMTERVVEKFEEANQALDAAIGNARVTAQYRSEQDAGEPVGNKAQGGFAGYFAAGGEPRGIDTMLARVDPREFIMNPQASARFKSQLIAMNQGWNPLGSPAQGPSTNVGDIHINVQGGSHSQATIGQIAAGLQRGIRRGTIKLGR
jgi:TP901 family phage tail tape measure protein